MLSNNTNNPICWSGTLESLVYGAVPRKCRVRASNASSKESFDPRRRHSQNSVFGLGLVLLLVPVLVLVLVLALALVPALVPALVLYQYQDTY